MTIWKTVCDFLRREPVLTVSSVLAALSMAAVPPGPDYAGYIDLRVLCLLFSLMAVVAALQQCGLFTVLAQKLLSGKKPFRLVCVLLVLLPFFCSMAVTNDVALITFVPFAILVLELAGRRDALIRVVVLQTVAANLGSMATPVGNPQNLYLYAHYQLEAGDFFALLLPLVAAGLAALLPACLWGGGEEVSLSFQQPARLERVGQLWVCLGLFLLCLLSVFRVLHYGLVTAAVAIVIGVLSPRTLKRVDYGLLLTFVFFFVFSGNLGRMPAVHQVLAALLARNTLLCSAAISQVISNVPAAVLLSGLTEDWQGLLAGVDVGGLGTPVASLASLISLKFYLRAEGARPGRYLLWFTLANAAGLALLLPLAAWLASM